MILTAQAEHSERRRRSCARHCRIASATGGAGDIDAAQRRPARRCLFEQKHYGEAEPLLQRDYDVLRAKAGEHDARTGDAAQRLIDLYEATGRGDLAQSLRDGLTSRMESPPDPNH